MTSVMDLFVLEIASFPDARETKGDMFGERSFRVGGREFLHIHGNSTLHILLSREAKAEAITCGQAHQHPYSARSGMVESHLHDSDQLAGALGLAKKSYDYVRRKAAAPASQPAPTSVSSRT
jgi:Family of unknown function (DUF5519)